MASSSAVIDIIPYSSTSRKVTLNYSEFLRCLQASRTVLCSIVVVIMCRFYFSISKLFYRIANPRIAALLDSVAPEFKIISLGEAFSNYAIYRLAVSTAVDALMPYKWPDE